MLVLTRNEGESVVIPKHLIRITVVSCRNGVTRIGIEAPANVDILREELLLRDVKAAAGSERVSKIETSRKGGVVNG